MSRQSHLPPRCPFQKKPFVSQCQGSSPQHYKYASQSSILEDQPSWLEDLLSDQDAESGRTSLRRSTSDTAALLGGLEETNTGWGIYSSGFERFGKQDSTSMYGPNSPRLKSFVPISDIPLASAMSEYSLQSSMQNVDEQFFIPENTYSDVLHPVGETISESKIHKRHSGQRSRVRKLQYIAELERTVENLQAIETELAVNVASMLQKRVSLSLEKTQLKQNIARLRQEKLVMEDQYRSMKKEIERLKNCLPNSATRTNQGPNMTWKMPDMTKLNLN